MSDASSVRLDTNFWDERHAAMDFGIYPPEINSGRMYTGPGAGPMLAAAAAWNGLAIELEVAAESYKSAISDLSASWWGPSSTAMVAAAAPYATWLHTTAMRAEDTATRAQAAVAAYEMAFAATVPPPVIAANRSVLVALVATNFLGQNSTAIATTEAQYAEMWAQDAAAMYGYAGSSASASTLPPFDPPRHNTAPGGVVGRAAAADPPSATTVLDLIGNLAAIFPGGPANLATVFAIGPTDILTGPVSFPLNAIGTVTGLHTDDNVSGWQGVAPWPLPGERPPSAFRALITNPGPPAASGATAGLGEANTIGAMSVPSTWTVAAPAVRSAALTLPAPPETTLGAAGEALEAGSGNTFGEMALGGMAGAGMGGGAGTGAGRDGGRPSGGTRVVAPDAVRANAGTGPTADTAAKPSPDTPRTVVTGVAARIREIAKLRNEGKLTDEEYAEEKNRLLAL